MDKKKVMLRKVHKTGRAKGSLRTDQTIGLCPLVLGQKLFVLSPPTPWPPPSSGPSLCSPSQLTHWEDLSVFSFYVLISCSLFFPLESDFHPFCLLKGILPTSPLSCHTQCPFVCSYLRQTFRSMPHSVCFFLFLKHFVLLVSHGILLLSPYLISYCFQSVSVFLLWCWNTFQGLLLGLHLLSTRIIFLGNCYGLNCAPPQIHMLKRLPMWLHLEIGSLGG